MSNQWQLQLDPLYGDEPLQFTGTSDDIVKALTQRFGDLVDEVDGEDLQAIVDHLNARVQAFDFQLQPLAQLAKGWPKDEKENQANRAGFFGSPEFQVAEDQHLEQGGGVEAKWNQQPPPSLDAVNLGGRSARSVRNEAGQDRAMIASAAAAGSLMIQAGNPRIRDAHHENAVIDGQLTRGPNDTWALGPNWPGGPQEPADSYYGWKPPPLMDRPEGDELGSAKEQDRTFWSRLSDAAGINPRPPTQEAQVRQEALKVRTEKEKLPAFKTRVIPPTVKKSDDATNLQQLVEDMLGFAPTKIPEFRAARLLARNQVGIDPPLEQMRRALYEHPTDMQAAALQGMGLAITDSNREALRQIQELGLHNSGRPSSMKKAETPALDPETLTHIRALDDDGQELEQSLRAAVQAQKYERVALEGKHSKGTLLVQTQDAGNWLLKPGSGNQSPAAGARQDNSSQSQREAGFWHVTRRWGMGEDFPRTELMDVGGWPYAVIEMLPYTWQNVGRIDTRDHQRIVRAIEKYRPSGDLHRWAVIDYVLGNPDRHQQNLMIGPEDELKLIDHGSAFAGTDFDPARDRRSFIPYYLRVNVPLENWDKYTPKQRMTFMPVIPEAEQRQVLTKWVTELDAELLGHQLQHFGIDPAPSQQRLLQVQKLVMALPMQPDKVINQLWATT